MFSLRHVYTTTKTRPKASMPKVANRSSSGLMSSTVIAESSEKMETASANAIQCLRVFSFALSGSHSYPMHTMVCTFVHIVNAPHNNQ